MPEATQIGVVTIAYGTATAEGPDGIRELTPNSPVFADDVITTKGGASAVEIKFSDGAILSQGPNSSVVLDTYVFNPDQNAGEMTVKLLQGTFRSVTGEIVDMNPEGFSLETPLATIGIRGTTTGHRITPGQPESHVVVDFVDKPVVIRPISGGPVAIITQDGGMVTASPGGLSPVAMASQNELAQFEQLSSQSLQQSAPDPGNGNDDDDDQDGDQDQSGSQDGNGEGEGEQGGQEAQGEGEGESGDGQGDQPAQGQGEGQGEGQGIGQNQGGVFNPGAGLGQGQGQGQGAAAPPAPKPATPPAPPAPTPPAQTGGTDTGDDADETPPDDDKPAQPAVVTTLDLSEWGDDLTVNLLGASPAYYETTGDCESRVSLADTATTTYAVHTVFGDASHDNILIGDNSDNDLYGGEGANSLNGGSGDDFLAVGHYESQFNSYHLGSISLDDTIDGGAGTDTLAFDGATDTLALNNVTSIEYIQLGSAAVDIQSTPDEMVDEGATLTLDGSLSSQVTFWGYNDTDSHFYLIGGSGDDYLKGSGLADTLFGGAGDDCLSGLGGDDTLFGTGGGNDTLLGGDGNDRFSLGTDLTGSDEINGGDGADSLYFTDNGDDTTELNNVTFVESIILGNADTHIVYVYSSQDYDETITIDGSAITGDNTLTYDGSGADKYQHVIGGANDDDIAGGDLDDTLDGGAGADTLRGGDGDDLFVFNTGDVASGEEIYGGEGTDRFLIQTSTSFADVAENEGIEEVAIAASQTITVDFGMESFVTGLDEILGNDQSSETVETFLISDLGGVNLLDLSGQTADFTDWNENDLFRIEGGDGNDTITTWDHATDIDGGDGDDEISGGLGNDTILGGDGNDIIDAVNGNNLLKGGSGDDEIHGGLGDDTIEGGTGADLLSGNDGFDMLSYESDATGVNVNLTTLSASGGHATGDDISGGGFEGVIGGSGNDTLIGTRHNERFEGGAGHDRIDGSGGADTGAGIGIDTVMGGAGNDTIVISTPVGTGSIYDGEAGTDTLELQTTAVFTAATVSGIEVIHFASSGKTATFGVAQMGAWTLSAFEPGSASTLGITGTAGGDVIDLTTLTLGTNWGLSGNVIAIQAGQGDDLIRASASAEYINGGDGFDTLDYSGSTAAVSVNLQTASVAGGYANNDSISGIAAVIGSDFADTLAGSDDSTNALYGGEGDDNFEMESYLDENDTISGGEGDDILTFTYNDDTMPLTNVTGIEHITLGDAATTLVGHDTLADYLSTFTLDATALSEGNNLDWDGTFIANFRQHVIGSDADDTIVGGSSYDTLLGGAGKDWLEGGAGCDSLDGGGNDELQRELDIASYENEEYAINANLFTGRVTGGGYTDTISGIEGIRGTTLGDTFVGDSGWVNLFFDGGGSDSYDGNSEHDPDEETGFDIVSYKYSGDGIIASMTGTSGTVMDVNETWIDTLTDIDMVWATPYDDMLTGDEGDQEFMPGWGNDLVDGGGSEDWDSVTYWALDSGVNVTWVTDHWQVTDPDVNWTDTLTNIEAIEGSAGDDSFTGSNNNDHFSGWAGADAFDGGNGMDTVSYEEDPAGEDGVTGVYVDLSNNTATDGWGNTESLISIEAIEGSDFADEILGSSGDNWLGGNDGDDKINGMGGTDTLIGGDGDDIFMFTTDPSEGTLVDGEDGTDTLAVNGTVDLRGISEIVDIEVMDFGVESTATVHSGLINNRAWQMRAEEGWATLAVLLAPGDVLDLTGLTFDQWGTESLIKVEGSTGSETIRGSSADDVLRGGEDSDSLFGGSGNDVLMAYGGMDTLTPVSGFDTLDGGAGIDTLTDTTSVDFSHMTISNIEVIEIPNLTTFTFSSSQMHGTESVVDGSGNIIIVGTPGDDTLDLHDLDVSSMEGNIFSDLGPGNDLFIGSNGSDFVIGGEGADTMTGGLGSDTFVYTSNFTEGIMGPLEGGDFILDFDANADKIGMIATFMQGWFDGNSLFESRFCSLEASEYTGYDVTFMGGSGFVYASAEDSSTGKLYFVADDSSEDYQLLATITEYSDGIQADNNLTADSFEALIGGPLTGV